MGEESAGDRTLGILSFKGGGRGLCELRFEHARLVGSAGAFLTGGGRTRGLRGSFLLAAIWVI